MNSLRLFDPDFTSELEKEELEYTDISLDAVKETMLCLLDIVQVAKKLGIKPRKIGEKTKEQADFGSTEVYVGNCLRCNEKGTLRIFPQQQTFGCRNCHWEGEYERHMNIFQLLRHCNESEYGYGHGYDTDRKMIKKLLKLFPLELASLEGHNLNRYDYRDNYFTAAEKSYPGIEADYKRNFEEMLHLERRQRSYEGRQQQLSREFYERLHKVREQHSKLHWIIEGQNITSRIYERRETVDNIVRTQSRADIGLESGIPDELLEERADYSESPFDPELGKLEHTNESVGIHFTTPVDPIVQRVRKSIELLPWVYGKDDAMETAHYIEIPDATFHSKIDRSILSHGTSNPVTGNYIIAYSAEENNFSVFLSSGHKEQKLHEFILHMRNPSWCEGSTPAFRIENVVGMIEGEDAYGNRFPFNGQENTPILPEGYREVATGGWINTPIGMYFAFGKNEYSGDNGRPTLFDKNLFYRCVQDISGFPVFTDRDNDKFISEYKYKVYEPREREAARRSYPFGRNY